MKHTKKALALLMVLVMSLSLLTVTAFAAGTGKIIIENATAGMEYKLYKVFDASYIDGTAGDTKPAGATYTIKSTDPWYSLVTLVTRFGKKLIRQKNFLRCAIGIKGSVNNTTQKERIPRLLLRRLLKGFKS